MDDQRHVHVPRTGTSASQCAQNEAIQDTNESTGGTKNTETLQTKTATKRKSVESDVFRALDALAAREEAATATVAAAKRARRAADQALLSTSAHMRNMRRAVARQKRRKEAADAALALRLANESSSEFERQSTEVLTEIFVYAVCKRTANNATTTDTHGGGGGGGGGACGGGVASSPPLPSPRDYIDLRTLLRLLCVSKRIRNVLSRQIFWYRLVNHVYPLVNERALHAAAFSSSSSSSSSLSLSVSVSSSSSSCTRSLSSPSTTATASTSTAPTKPSLACTNTSTVSISTMNGSSIPLLPIKKQQQEQQQQQQQQHQQQSYRKAPRLIQCSEHGATLRLHYDIVSGETLDWRQTFRGATLRGDFERQNALAKEEAKKRRAKITRGFSCHMCGEGTITLTLNRNVKTLVYHYCENCNSYFQASGDTGMR